MRIRIEFSTTEKVAIMNACDEHEDEYSVKSEGNFGKAEYNAEQNFLDFDFKENFIVATANLLGTFVNMAKTLVNTWKIFESSWLKDNKVVRVKKEEESTPEADESQEA